MKGSAGAIAAVVAIVVVAVAGYLIFSQGAFPGLGILQTGSFSNNVVSVENLVVTDSQPFEGSETSVMFFVRNSGEETIDEVVVDFFDMPGFDKSSMKIKCGFADEFSSSSKCSIRDFEPFDVQPVEATFRASPLQLNTDQRYDVRYSVGYFFETSREAFIPIVSDVATAPRNVRFSLSKAPYSPVQVVIEPPVGAVRTEGSSTITENFARTGSSFKLKFSASDVRGGVDPDIETVEFGGDSGYMVLSADDFDISVCDRFKLSTDLSDDELGVKVTKDTNPFLRVTAVPSEEIEVPFTAECSMTPHAQRIDDPFVLGKVRIDYGFEYLIKSSISLTVKNLDGEIQSQPER
jgi:hypothetical protein